MKIMFYISSLGKGGAERVISNLANMLIYNHDVTIILNRNVQSYFLNEKIRIKELDENKIKNSLLRNLIRIIKTKNICKKEKFDVIISFLPIPSFRILFLKPFIKTKIIISDRNDPKEEYKLMFIKLLMKWLYRRADGFVFQTKQQQEYFPEKIKEKSIIIFNLVKEEFLIREDTKQKENIIINIGRLVEQKNQRMLIHAFSKIADKYKNYSLRIFGDGPLKEYLQTEISNLNMESRIKLCGITNNIRLEMEKSKIFVLSSNYEGMPNTLIEAMTLGLPCISTDCPCGGPKELIKNEENGILIPVGDEKKLIEKLNKLIKDTNFAEKLRNEAKKIKYKVEPSKILKQWEDYIECIYKKRDKSI